MASWSDLLDVLLEKIFERLPLGDYLRSSAVCQKWRAAQAGHRALHAPSPPPSSLRLPWIYINRDEENLMFYSPFEGRDYKIRIPEQHRFFDVGMTGWLVVVPECQAPPYLWNPVSGAKFNLPRLPQRCFNLIRLLSPPRWDASGCVIVIARNYLFLTFIGGNRDGTEGWTSVPFPLRIFPSAVVAGKFYGLQPEDFNSLVVVNPLLPRPELEVLNMVFSEHVVFPTNTQTWLMECSGELLLVVHCLQVCQRRLDVHYKFFKADLEKREWIQLKNNQLHDMAVFLDFCFAACIPIARLGGGVRADAPSSPSPRPSLSFKKIERVSSSSSSSSGSSSESSSDGPPAKDIWYINQRDDDVAIFDGCLFAPHPESLDSWFLPTL